MVFWTPLIVLAALELIGLGYIAAKNGQPQADYSFGSSLFATIILWAFILAAVL